MFYLLLITSEEPKSNGVRLLAKLGKYPTVALICTGNFILAF